MDKKDRQEPGREVKFCFDNSLIEPSSEVAGEMWQVKVLTQRDQVAWKRTQRDQVAWKWQKPAKGQK